MLLLPPLLILPLLSATVDRLDTVGGVLAAASAGGGGGGDCEGAPTVVRSIKDGGPAMVVAKRKVKSALVRGESSEVAKLAGAQRRV
jgi:hypothetical protein